MFHTALFLRRPIDKLYLVYGNAGTEILGFSYRLH